MTDVEDKCQSLCPLVVISEVKKDVWGKEAFKLQDMACDRVRDVARRIPEQGWHLTWHLSSTVSKGGSYDHGKRCRSKTGLTSYTVWSILLGQHVLNGSTECVASLPEGVNRDHISSCVLYLFDRRPQMVFWLVPSASCGLCIGCLE